MGNRPALPGVEGFIPVGPNAPAITTEYRDALSSLVLLQDQGVTHFLGCELDLADDRHVWLSPVEVDDGQHHSYFQILYVNTRPEHALNSKDLPVSLLEVDEASYKLTSTEHPAYQQLLRQLNGDKQRILIRRCNTGMAYYPRSITPDQEDAVVEQHLERLIHVTGLREPEVSISISKPSGREDEPEITTRMLDAVHARKYQFAGGEVYSYGLVLGDDPWQYYEVFTPERLETMPRKDLLVRIDSGCDIGQIYDDRGCDCREQLHTALQEMQQTGNGAVIHIPAQDGRGYGAATKMETEGLKRGIEVATNRGRLEPVDTITAARLLLGEHFDIRTYDGAGQILGMLGVESVLLQTDNRLKTEGLATGGIVVQRKPTGTSGANGSQHHVAAKHKHSDIYYGDGHGE